MKSRFARSASIEPPCSGATSQTKPARAITRHAPNSSDSGNAGPPAAAATARATRSGSPVVTRSMSVIGRPRIASRTAPPTTHTEPLWPPSASRTSRTGSDCVKSLADAAHALWWTRRTRGDSPQVIS